MNFNQTETSQEWSLEMGSSRALLWVPEERAWIIMEMELENSFNFLKKR